MDSKAHFEPISNRTRCHAIFEENTGPVKNNGCYRLRESNTFSRAFLFALGPPLPALVSGVVILGRDGEKGGVLFSRISVGRGKFAPSTKRAFPSVYPRNARGGPERWGGAEFFGLHVALLGIGNQPNIAKRHRECLNGQLTRVSHARAKVRFAIEDGKREGCFRVSATAKRCVFRGWILVGVSAIWGYVFWSLLRRAICNRIWGIYIFFFQGL